MHGTISSRPLVLGNQGTIPVGACAIVEVIARSTSTERVPMTPIPQRIASAFAVLCGQFGDVTNMARARERSRKSLYREAEQVTDAVDGAAARARINELQQQFAARQAEVQALREVSMDPNLYEDTEPELFRASLPFPGAVSSTAAPVSGPSELTSPALPIG